MNILRFIYPLRLRSAIFFRFLGSQTSWPKMPPAGFPLALAPVAINALKNTDLSHRSIAWTGLYDLELTRKIAELGRRGGTFIDVGANIGYFSLLWACLRDSNRVLAFEPSPRNLTMLEANITRSNMSARIRVFPIAAGRARGEISFDPGPLEQTGWGGLTLRETPNSFRVAVETLDDVLHDIESVAVLKIDAEGADAWVLEGAKRLLGQRRVKHIFCEINVERMHALGIDENQPARILESHGYIFEPLKGSPSELHAFLPD